jgi:tRNA(fMet)-specific endonuclease VapC
VKRFLLDTDIASDYINRRHGVYERARAEVTLGNAIGIGLPVLAELAAGIEHSASRDRNMKSLRAALASLKLWPLDQDSAFEYGLIYAELARIGRPIGIADMMIAAIGRTLPNCTVVSADSDLKVVPRLLVENWRNSTDPAQE